MAAIDELESNTERKEYLDSQLEDLNSALSTLEGAIRKIDTETRSRFRETFNKVNSGFESLFPKLFGGGQAYMELIGNDLLTAGVTVMAITVTPAVNRSLPINSIYACPPPNSFGNKDSKPEFTLLKVSLNRDLVSVSIFRIAPSKVDNALFKSSN